MGCRAKLDELFPKGFHPKDEEIIQALQHKELGQTNDCVIPHVAVHEQDEPWELAAMINEMYEWKLKEWCFIRSFKGRHKNGKRQCRTTRCGYWKVIGKERKIRSEDADKIIGTKKTLVFYTGRVPEGQRTNWVMHEYNLTPKYLAKHDKQDQMGYVGCRQRKKNDKKGAFCGASQSDQADDHSFVEDGPHSSCNAAPGTEIAEILGNQEMQINNSSRLEEEPFPLDVNHLDVFSRSEFSSDIEMEDGSAFMGGGGGDDEWKTLGNCEELNDPEDGKGRGLLNDFILLSLEEERNKMTHKSSMLY